MTRIRDALLWALLPGTALAGWPLEAIDAADQPRLDVDDAGTAHVVAFDGDDLMYSTGAPGAWTTVTALSGRDVSAVDLAVNPRYETPAIAWTDSRGVHVAVDNGGWLSERISPDDAIGVSVGHFPNGRLLVTAYEDGGSMGLWAAMQMGSGTWARRSVDPDAVGGHGAAARVRMGPGGEPRIGYLAATDGMSAEARVATWDGSTWQVEIAAPALPGGTLDAAVDPAGNTHLLYLDDAGRVVLTDDVSGSWRTEVLPVSLDVVSTLTLEIDNRGGRHVLVSGTVDPLDGGCVTDFSETRYLTEDASGWRDDAVTGGIGDVTASLGANGRDAPFLAVSSDTGLQVAQRNDSVLTVSVASTSTAAPGGVMELSVTVANHGSRAETFDLATLHPLGACDALRTAGVGMGLSSQPITVPAGASRSALVERRVPATAPSGAYQMALALTAGGQTSALGLTSVEMDFARLPVTVHGTVRLTNDLPVPYVKVSAGAASTYTDGDGRYVLEDVPLQTNGVLLVEATHVSYPDQFARLELEGGEVHQVDLRMKAPDLSGSFRSVNSPIALDNSHGTVLIDSNAPSSGGEPITGFINVEVVTGDPTDAAEVELMPGSFMSLANGGTPLESIAFFDITVFDANTGERYDDVTASVPIEVTMPVPASLQAEVHDGETIELWSLNEETGAWVIEGEATVFDNAGTLWVRAELTHLSWWNVDRPVEQHGCLVTTVVDGSGDPLSDTRVVVKGRSYNGTSMPVFTDNAGRAQLTAKNSSGGVVLVDVFAELGALQVPHPDNPITMPTTVGSCLRGVGCPANCDTLDPIPVDLGGTVQGQVTLRDGSPGVGLQVISSHGTHTETGSDGRYDLPVLMDLPFDLRIGPHVSGDLTATDAAPVVTYDLDLENLEPFLVSLTVDGQEAFSYPRWGSQQLYVYSSWDLGRSVDIAATFEDPDGDALTYAWTDLFCYGNQTVAWACSPTDRAKTTCTPPDGFMWSCEGVLSVDDGYMPAPLEVNVTLWRPEDSSGWDTWIGGF